MTPEKFINNQISAEKTFCFNPDNYSHSALVFHTITSHAAVRKLNVCIGLVVQFISFFWGAKSVASVFLPHGPLGTRN